MNNAFSKPKHTSRYIVLAVIGLIIILAIIGALIYSSRKNTVTTTPASNTQASAASSSNTVSSQLNLNTLLTNLQKQYPTIQQTYIYSSSQDPNGNLGKVGYYIAGAEFYDTRTNTPPDGAAFGADSGGAIEVYSNTSDAAKRVAYLQQFQGNPALDPGAATQVGNVVVRSSSKYNAADQKQVLDYLASLVRLLTH